MIGSSWALDPESVTAIVTAVTGFGILISAVFAVSQVREARRARDADVLLRLLGLISQEFLPTDVYTRLLAKAGTMRALNETMKWRGPLDPDDVALLRLLKFYAVAGWMLRERMIKDEVLLRFLAEPLLHHYSDFEPFIETAMERDGIEVLKTRAERAGYFPSAL